jgi:hypothetical protein
MNSDRDWDSTQIEKSLQEISEKIWTVARECQGDSRRLLYLLRFLEILHRDIREQLFEPSLPDTRNALTNLLKEIEETGGWPYIERMRLQALINNFLTAEQETKIPDRP